MEAGFARPDAKLEQRIGEVRTGLRAVETRLIRWMLLFWVGTLGTLIALVKL